MPHSTVGKMTSDELALEVAKVHAEALTRIRVEGHESYAIGFYDLTKPGFPQGQSQRFESESVEDELDNLEEELLDTINWASMAIIKLRERRIRAEEDPGLA